MSLNITIILGTTRPGNKSQQVAKFLFDKLQSVDDVEVQQISPNMYDLTLDGNDEEVKIPEYTEIVKWSDAFVIVSPEYNHSFPGSLKSLLDKELLAYNHRVAGLVGVSKGLFAGTRVVESLLPVMRELGLIVSHTSLHIPRVRENFDENGQTKEQAIHENADKFIKELIWMTKTLKWGRQNLDD